MRRSLLLTSALLLLPCIGAAQSPTTSASVQAATREIQAIVEAFRTSIIEKDKAKFLGTLINENIPWISVYEEETFRRRQEASVEPEKRSREYKGSAKSFIDAMVTLRERQEEKFSNVQISTDGSIGSVVFDYSFHSAGRMTNWGKESWHVVNTNNGWKINSVIYTITLPELPKRKEVVLPPSAMTKYVGRYEVSSGSNLAIGMTKDRLTVSLGGESPLYLFAESSTRFFDKLFDSTSEFVVDERGTVTGVSFTVDGKTINARRLP